MKDCTGKCSHFTENGEIIFPKGIKPQEIEDYISYMFLIHSFKTIKFRGIVDISSWRGVTGLNGV